LVYKLLQQETVELDMESNPAKANHQATIQKETHHFDSKGWQRKASI